MKQEKQAKAKRMNDRLNVCYTQEPDKTELERMAGSFWHGSDAKMADQQMWSKCKKNCSVGS